MFVEFQREWLHKKSYKFHDVQIVALSRLKSMDVIKGVNWVCPDFPGRMAKPTHFTKPVGEF